MQQLKKWIDDGELAGEVRGGMYFVDLQAAVIGSTDPLLAQMLELRNGTAPPQPEEQDASTQPVCQR
ncbi:hypothetical protein D3C76_1722490 [compost metagenome]